MQLVEMVPIARGIFKETLSFFSAKEIAPGAIVSGLVRGRSVDGLVTNVLPLASAKTAVRQSDYLLKKITSVKTPRLVSLELIKSAAQTADYFALPLGQVLASLIPRLILEKAAEAPLPAAPADQGLAVPPLKPEKLALLGDGEARFGHYRSLIREEFARRRSILIIEPTVALAEAAAERLRRGIADYLVVLHSDLKPKELWDRWRRAAGESHPLCVIATPSFMSLPRADWQTVILDQEGNAAYQQVGRPQLDLRVAIEKWTEVAGYRLILGDFFWRLETYHRLRDRRLVAIGNTHRHRSPTRRRLLVVKAEKEEVLAAETKDLILKTVGRGDRAFIVAGRRGLAPVVICQDCGQLVTCDNCHAPMVLHDRAEVEGSTTFACHQCGARRTAEDKCRGCGGWRLKELGVGVEKIIRELKDSLAPEAIFRLDSDSVEGRAKAVALVKKFLETPGALLVGTEMILNYLTEPVGTGALVAVDSLLALPNFRSHERVLRLSLAAAALADRHFVIQTRQPDEPLFAEIVTGEDATFYRRELENRENFGYPPFRRLIKISLAGRGQTAAPLLKELQETKLSGYQSDLYPSLQPGRFNLLVRLPPEAWPDGQLVAIIKNLPPRYIVTVDHSSIL